MFEAFKARKSWVVVIISLVLSPVIGMCYLNRGRLAVVYLGLLLIADMLDVYSSYDLSYSLFGHAVWGYIPYLVGTAHCYYLTKSGSFFTFLKWYARWYGLVSIFLVPVILIGVVRTFYYEPFKISSVSMSPNLNPGDNFFASKMAYGYSRYSFPFGIVPFKGHILSGDRKPQRGDVVAFRIPQNTAITYIKRVVGLPGDVIEMRREILYINGQEAYREKVLDFCLVIKGYKQCLPQYRETLPDGVQYNILQEITGGPLDDMEPRTVPEGHYFVIGDNRDNSQDSRVPVFGFVPEDNIYGKFKWTFYRYRD